MKKAIGYTIGILLCILYTGCVLGVQYLHIQLFGKSGGLLTGMLSVGGFLLLFIKLEKYILKKLNFKK